MRAQRTEADKRLPGRPVSPAPSIPVIRRQDAATAGDVRTPAGILQLQRAIGNRAVGSLLRGKAGRSIQRFPFAFSERNGQLRLSGRLEWPYLNLYSHGIEIGYIKVSTRGDGAGGHILELKDIIVHDVGMRAAGLGTVLVFLFGELASHGRAGHRPEHGARAGREPVPHRGRASACGAGTGADADREQHLPQQHRRGQPRHRQRGPVRRNETTARGW
jgi:hypothetical protein